MSYILKIGVLEHTPWLHRLQMNYDQEICFALSFAAPSPTRGGGTLTTDSVTFGPTGWSTARSDGAHGGGFGGVFGCFGSGPFGRAFALGVPRREGVWVSSEELSARWTVGSTPRLLLSSSGVGGVSILSKNTGFGLSFTLWLWSPNVPYVCCSRPRRT